MVRKVDNHRKCSNDCVAKARFCCLKSAADDSNINSNDTETDISNDLPANLTVPKQVGTTLRR